MVSIGAVIGGAAMIKVIKYASPKSIQLWGFMVLFILFIVTGSAWTKLLDSSRSGLIVLYVLSQIAFNLGPNVTTFIVSALFIFIVFSQNTRSRLADSCRNLPHTLPLHSARHRGRRGQVGFLASTDLPRLRFQVEQPGGTVRLGAAKLRTRSAGNECVHGGWSDSDVLSGSGDEGPGGQE